MRSKLTFAQKADLLALKEKKLKRKAVAYSFVESSKPTVVLREWLSVPRDAYAAAAKMYYADPEVLKKRGFRDSDVLFRLTFSFGGADSASRFEGRMEYCFPDPARGSASRPYVNGVIQEKGSGRVYRLKRECRIADGEETVFVHYGDDGGRDEMIVVCFCLE